MASRIKVLRGVRLRPVHRMLPVLFLLAGVLVISAAADAAKSLYDKGKDAEIRQDFIAAFDFYRQALDLKPGDLRYRVAVERTKFLAAATYVQRGQQLRDQGKLPEALQAFETARSEERRVGKGCRGG